MTAHKSVDALVLKVGKLTGDGRIVTELTVPPGPIPARLPDHHGFGVAQARITDEGVVARVVLPEAYADALLSGELRLAADMMGDVHHADGVTELRVGELLALTLTDQPPAWDDLWVREVTEP